MILASTYLPSTSSSMIARSVERPPQRTLGGTGHRVRTGLLQTETGFFNS